MSVILSLCVLISLLLTVLSLLFPSLTLFWIKNKQGKKRSVAFCFYLGCLLVLFAFNGLTLNIENNWIFSFVIVLIACILFYFSKSKYNKHTQVKSESVILKDVSLKEKSVVETKNDLYVKSSDDTFLADEKHDLKLVEYDFLRKYKCVLKNGTKFPRSWSYTFDINPQDLLISLHQLGYYKEAQIKDVLSVQKIDVLKNIALNKQIKVSGNKEKIINTLCNVLSQQDLINFNLNNYLSLSDKAKEAISDHNYAKYLLEHHIERDMEAHRLEPKDEYVVLYKKFMIETLTGRKSKNDTLRTFIFLNEENQFEQGFPFLCRSYLLNINDYDEFIEHGSVIKDDWLFFRIVEWKRNVKLIQEDFNNDYALGVITYADGFRQAKDKYEEQFDDILKKNLLQQKLRINFVSLENAFDLIKGVVNDDQKFVLKIIARIISDLKNQMTTPFEKIKREIYPDEDL